MGYHALLNETGKVGVAFLSGLESLAALNRRIAVLCIRFRLPNLNFRVIRVKLERLETFLFAKFNCDGFSLLELVV